MIIKELKLTNFGKFHGESISFKEGINIVYGENEAGKSTMHFFITLMINGLNSLNNNPIVEDTESILNYLPLDDETQFDGELYFEYLNQNYILYRSFFIESPEIKLYRLGNDSERTLIDDLEKFNLGTLEVKNISNIYGQDLLLELKDRIINKSSTNLEDIDYNKVIENLNGNKNDLENERKNYIVNHHDVINEKENGRLIKKLYFDRGVLKDNKLLIEENVKDVELTVGTEVISSKINDYYDFLVVDRKMKNIKVKADGLEKFNELNSTDYNDYYNLKRLLEEKEIEVKSINDSLNLSMDSENISYNAILQDKISDERYFFQFNDELNYYRKLLKEEKDINEEILECEKRIDKYDNDNISQQYLAELDRDYFSFMDLVNQAELYIRDDSEEEGKLKYSEQIAAEKEKRLSYRIKFIISLIFLVVALGATYYFIPNEIVVIIGSSVLILVVMLFLLFLLPLGYNISKLENIALYVEKNNQKRYEELDIIKLDIKSILEKYNFSDEDEFKIFYEDTKLAVKSEKITFRDLSIFKDRISEINNRIASIKRNVLLRMEQCDIKDDFSIDNVENVDIIQGFLNKNKEYAGRYGSKLNKIEDLKTMSNKLDMEIASLSEKIKSNKRQYFEKYSYDEILDFKIRYKGLKEEINLLESEKQKLIMIFEEVELSEFQELYGSDIETVDKIKNQYSISEELMKEKHIYLDEMYEINKSISEINKEILFLTKLKREQCSYVQQCGINRIKLNEIDEELIVITQVINLLTKSSEKIKDTVYPKIIEAVNNNLKLITHKYDKLSISDNFEVNIQDEHGEVASIDDLSLGTIDQIYFAIRVALIKAFSQEEEMIIILDDAFIQYDIDRFNNVMDIIHNLKGQVILMTCYTREKEYAMKNSKDVNYIEI